MKSSEIQFNGETPFYKVYIDVLGEVDLMQCMRNQLKNFPQFLSSIPDEKYNFAYATSKWTVAEVIHHIIDTERVFQYRALRFSRGDTTALSGFDQDLFVSGANTSKRTKQSLINQYQIVRQSTILLFENFDNEILERRG